MACPGITWKSGLLTYSSNSGRFDVLMDTTFGIVPLSCRNWVLGAVVYRLNVRDTSLKCSHRCTPTYEGRKHEVHLL